MTSSPGASGQVAQQGALPGGEGHALLAAEHDTLVELQGARAEVEDVRFVAAGHGPWWHGSPDQDC